MPAVVCEHGDIKLLDGDGTVLSTVPQGESGTPGFAAGARLLPPLRFWPLLQIRAPRGSAALRRIDEDTERALTAAVTEQRQDTGDTKAAGPDGPGRLLDLIRTLLPEVGHPALRAGIAGVVRCTARYRSAVDAVRARLDAAVLAATDGKGSDQEEGARGESRGQ